MCTASTVRHTLSVALLVSALILLVGGCSSATSTNTRSGGTPVRAYATVISPVVPSATATALPNPTVPAYLLPSAPLLPAGWSWYRDNIGHFQVPIAPGWGVGTFYGDWSPEAESCKYRIQFFPPGTAVTPGQASATFAPRLIEILVNLSCPPPPWSITPDQYDVQESNPIMVDDQPVTLWDNDPAAGEIYRYALTAFGGRQYEFDLQARPDSVIAGDLKIFLQMLHGFQYMGK